MTSTRCASVLLITAAMLAPGTLVLAQTQTVGLFQNSDAAFDGYTIMSPLNGTKTYLLNMDGRPVHSWQSTLKPGLLAYLLPNGHILRAGAAPVFHPNFTTQAGGGGVLEEYDWDGTVVWSFVYSNDDHLQHHDFTKLPNGNVLLFAWEYKTTQQAILAGRNPARILDGYMWGERIVEIQPVLPSGGIVVWEWHSWDHMVQDFDPTKLNFGNVSASPGLIDFNPPDDDGHADYIHLNGIGYHPEFDQIVMSSHRYSEFWVIDHGTTTAQAAGHTGGHYGKGGDLLYRWGNPENYDAGPASSQHLYRQHDSHWITPGLPGAGDILVFNNGAGRPAGPFSTVEQITPPVDQNGYYSLQSGSPYGPTNPTWQYQATPPNSFYGSFISGADRMPNGNTLICSGPQGLLFEVTNAGQTVWKYANPVGAMGTLNQGQTPAPLDTFVFKVRRYPPDYPGLVGRTLVAGPPIEGHTAPRPVPDGTLGTTALKAQRLTTAGDQIKVTWDPTSCPAPNYKIIYGPLASVSSYAVTGARCAVGTSGTHTWTAVPAGSLYFVMAGVDASSLYESSWGKNSAGGERNGTTSSFTCGTTTKSDGLTCP